MMKDGQDKRDRSSQDKREVQYMRIGCQIA